MAKFRKFSFHRFSGSKLPQQMVLAIFTRCLVPELCILCHFGVKSAFLGLNSSRTKEMRAKPMVLSYVGHFSKHWKKILGAFFSKSPKKLIFKQIYPIFSQPRPFLKKTALWRLIPYGYLTSYQISEKLLERLWRYAVMNGRTDEWTDGQDWFYRSLGFQPGTNKTNMIKVNSVRRDYWLLGFV